MAKLLQVNVARKDYHDAPPVQALGGVQFDVQPREFVSILGPSGCGKSTLLRLISGLDTNFEGQISIGERVVQGPARDCGIVFQEPTLLPWFTVRRNVEFAIGSAQDATTRSERARSLLLFLGLERFSDAFPTQLSGGMAQRVALARALFNLPDVLLLDEPLASLDELTRMHLQGELQRVLEKERTTVLLVTHNIEEAIFLSDRILIMSERPGRIVDSYAVSLAKPRDRGSVEFAELEAQILKRMVRIV